MSRWNPFGVSQWIAWLGATLAASVVMTFSLFSYAHSTFVTQRELFLIVDRLDRIEKKLDEGLKWLQSTNQKE